ncbi:PPM-type phosphatase-like domain [Dillenia turbinata]|uniref:PPM-type phosphatase-like domain n=1 Tax=Dillenia turbinata TaxID=194707 RepID=A0AAN8UU69_9MAGN
MKPQIASVGSSCLVEAIANDQLYVANLGDSRVVLGCKDSKGEKNSVVAKQLSTDHNIGVEEVRKEVNALYPDDSHIVIYTRPVMTSEPSILSRNLNSQDLFLISALNGLWEQLSDEAAIENVFKNPGATVVMKPFFFLLQLLLF